MIPHNPASIAIPFARYSHAVEIPAGWRLLRTSGQLGADTNGTIPKQTRAQADICFGNIDAILNKAGMTREDIFHISAFVTGREHMADYMAARDDYLNGITVLPASTLLIVTGFTRPEFTVEIEVSAAAP